MGFENGKMPLQSGINSCCQALVDSLPVIIFQVQYHTSGKITVNYVNDIFFEVFFNMTPEDVRNNPEKMFDLIADDQKSHALRLFRSLIKSPSDFHLITYVMRKNDSIRQISISAKLLDIREDGSIWNGIIADIAEKTSYKTVTENDTIAPAEIHKKQNRQSEDQPEKSVVLLTGGIAHELNNAFSAILGFSELALEETLPGSLVRENIEEVMIAGERAKKLVERLSKLTKKMRSLER
jgi:signal transduction histidine kinase